MSAVKLEQTTRDRGRHLPYFLIAVLALFCHGFILTNDGTIWDSWYVLNFLETRNWTTMNEFFNSVGMPLYAWLYRQFAFLPNIVSGFMVATFLCLLGCGILIYHLSLNLGRLTRSESLALALLAQAMPLFSAAQDFIMFFFIFTYTLFLASALLAVLMLDLRGWRRWLARGLAVLGFYISFSNAALLVFYGFFFLLFFSRAANLRNLPFFAASSRFVSRYPEFLALPAVTWALRIWLTPQYGKYEFYNNPAANLPFLVPNFLSFFQNALLFHAQAVLAWPQAHPLATALLLTVVLVVVRGAPASWHAQRGSLSTVHLVTFGTAALCLAVLPFAAAGKTFTTIPLGEMSRHCILTGLPLAILVLALLRVLFLGRVPANRWFAPVAGCLTIVLASGITPVYVMERAEWIYSKAVLRGAVKNEAVRNSSVIVLQGFSVIQQDAYALFGFSTAFGELTRLVTRQTPKNRQFFTPVEIGRILWRTTFLPNNFRHIRPGGQQIHLNAIRTPDAGSRWQIVARYLELRYFGTPEQLGTYLDSLVTLDTTVLKPSTPFSPAPVSTAAPAGETGDPTADFTNTVGMRMVRLPGGWWAGAFETTQDAYERVMAGNPSVFKDPSRPVETVSWFEAMEFSRRLTALETKAGKLPPGFVYRLPTTQEFDSFAGTLTDSAITSAQFTRWQTEPAGSSTPNQFGLYDTFGNVWEWCLDWEDAAHHFKIAKGGAWVNDAQDLAPLTRIPANNRSGEPRRTLWRKDFPDQGFMHRGFRAVLAPAMAEPVLAAAR